MTIEKLLQCYIDNHISGVFPNETPNQSPLRPIARWAASISYRLILHPRADPHKAVNKSSFIHRSIIAVPPNNLAKRHIGPWRRRFPVPCLLFLMRPNTGQYEPRCGWRAAGEVSHSPILSPRRSALQRRANRILPSRCVRPPLA